MIGTLKEDRNQELRKEARGEGRMEDGGRESRLNKEGKR